MLAASFLCMGPAHGQSNDVDPALIGALDLHAHLDPDGYGPGRNGRSLDVFDLAELARAAGMRGFVIKQHYDQSADSAYLVRKLYPDLEVFGGIGTNFATGGLNPHAILLRGRLPGSARFATGKPSILASLEKSVSWLLRMNPPTMS
jgi:hypothetical protein